MLARVESMTVLGIEAVSVEVEVDFSNGLPAFNIVGLADLACRESADRVRSALKNSGFPVPLKRITVNLAPAELKKEGACFDLPIALGILAADGMIEPASLEKKVFCGELSLNGALRPISGILPRAAVLAGKNYSMVVPEANSYEAAVVKDLEVYSMKTLAETVRFLLKEENKKPVAAPEISFSKNGFSLYPDFGEVKGQEHVKRGLLVAAAGGHNVLLIGPPGAGKSMLAKRLPGILPPMSFEEAVETTKIHSVAGLVRNKKSLITERSFRSPHHTISHVAMVGGGTYPRPGEISLAHNGILFLDELAEFQRHVLEVLRQPLEESRIFISRASQSLSFPASFMLVAATNPCPCGYFTDPRRECKCSSRQIKKYLARISGPLLDRIDIQLEVPALKMEEMRKKKCPDESPLMKQKVEQARERQGERYRRRPCILNAGLGPKEIEIFCHLTDEAQNLLEKGVVSLGLSARAYHKIIKIARSIADLEGVEIISVGHIAEAIGYRSLDRQLLWTR